MSRAWRGCPSHRATMSSHQQCQLPCQTFKRAGSMTSISACRQDDRSRTGVLRAHRQLLLGLLDLVLGDVAVNHQPATLRSAHSNVQQRTGEQARSGRKFIMPRDESLCSLRLVVSWRSRFHRALFLICPLLVAAQPACASVVSQCTVGPWSSVIMLDRRRPIVHVAFSRMGPCHLRHIS